MISVLCSYRQQLIYLDEKDFVANHAGSLVVTYSLENI